MKTMKTCKTGCGKMKSGGKVTAVKKMAKGGYAPAQTGGDNTKMNIFGIPNAGTTGPNRTAGYEYKKGGATTSRAVKESCKKGRVRSADGKCVMSRPKFKSGGPLKPVPTDNVGLSKLPTAVRNKMGYMKKGGVKKR
jgi:hypothetical protein